MDGLMDCHDVFLCDVSRDRFLWQTCFVFKVAFIRQSEIHLGPLLLLLIIDCTPVD